MRVLTIIGARPQFIKAAMVSAALAKAGEGLDVKAPDVDLGVKGNGTHWEHVLAVLANLKGSIYSPDDWVLVYGDTNSAVAGALFAKAKGIKLAHVEAGVRSLGPEPEEVNRIMIDSMADLHLCPTESAAVEVDGLFVGDVLYDSWLKYNHSYSPGGSYTLVTVHRAENCTPEKLAAIRNLLEIDQRIVFPAHPKLKDCGMRTTKPAHYIEMLGLIQGAAHVITDSGGVQREAYWAQVPCTVLREQDEWPETRVLGGQAAFGDGNAATKIVEALCEY